MHLHAQRGPLPEPLDPHHPLLLGPPVEDPFYLLDPAALAVPPAEAAATRTAAVVAPTVEVDALRPLDLIVLGSVAVNRDGARIGKGAGYSDIEFALLTKPVW
ncbi:5-formyltetrahydrofolate cyclo-ligase [Streptomyces sp. NPDC127100]|uniref:5-formyltetrahydrofolate cyclo-ligase n=1 Tax=Streptomyces sp. NPDC127100 TaxID=3347138 RepID=UPI00365C66ED